MVDYNYESRYAGGIMIVAEMLTGVFFFKFVISIRESVLLLHLSCCCGFID